jgi:hypothetical protein
LTYASSARIGTQYNHLGGSVGAEALWSYQLSPFTVSSARSSHNYTGPVLFVESAQNARLVKTRASNDEADPEPEVSKIARQMVDLSSAL